MAKKKAAKKKAAKKPVLVRKKPRQTSLPGMENRKIAELQRTALDYADVRDQRMELSKQESDLKKELLGMMHTHKMEHYEYGNVIVDVVHEEETVKVKVKAENEEAEQEPELGQVEEVEEVEEQAELPTGEEEEPEPEVPA
jgi:hypothetical protein